MLPYDLQERWPLHGCNFKEEYNIPLQLFAYFLDFVCHQASSFSFLLDTIDPLMMGKSTPKCSTQRSLISVHKTERCLFTCSLSDASRKRKVAPANQCPDTKKKLHPLRKCHEFREKSTENRKAQLCRFFFFWLRLRVRVRGGILYLH